MEQDNQPSLGGRLRTARTEAGLSIRELARLTGVSHAYLFKLEAGQKENPSAEKLQRLAEVLEIDPSTLLQYVGVEVAATLPPAKVYFRNKYGMSEEDAEQVARLVEDYTKQRK